MDDEDGKPKAMKFAFESPGKWIISLGENHSEVQYLVSAQNLVEN